MSKEVNKCGTTHYAGCECHEEGWRKRLDMERQELIGLRSDISRLRKTLDDTAALYREVDEERNALRSELNQLRASTRHDTRPVKRALKLSDALVKVITQWERQKHLFPELLKDGWMDLAIGEAKALVAVSSDVYHPPIDPAYLESRLPPSVSDQLAAAEHEQAQSQNEPARCEHGVHGNDCFRCHPTLSQHQSFVQKHCPCGGIILADTGWHLELIKLRGNTPPDSDFGKKIDQRIREAQVLERKLRFKRHQELMAAKKSSLIGKKEASPINMAQMTAAIVQAQIMAGREPDVPGAIGLVVSIVKQVQETIAAEEAAHPQQASQVKESGK